MQVRDAPSVDRRERTKMRNLLLVVPWSIDPMKDSATLPIAMVFFEYSEEIDKNVARLKLRDRRDRCTGSGEATFLH